MFHTVKVKVLLCSLWTIINFYPYKKKERKAVTYLHISILMMHFYANQIHILTTVRYFSFNVTFNLTFLSKAMGN